MTRPLAALVVLLAFGGCSAEQYFRPEPRPPGDEGEWAAVRDRATRTGKLYDGFGTNAFVKATYLSLAVREARVARLATWTAMTPEERDRLLAGERAEAEEYDEFLVALFTPDRPANDLDASHSVWRVALVVQGEGEELPQRIVQVRQDVTLRALYPALDPFDTVYQVRFERFRPPLAGRAFTLRLSGAKGLVDLGFD
ncbi:MAG TPA: hypothetical protein VMG32_04980 [Anaeromyxobacteraceae bacterium]|nr:hypothetical protein [Anaeromyxobacteraceae bacterium]